jgi:hypothetical protein
MVNYYVDYEQLGSIEKLDAVTSIFARCFSVLRMINMF